MISQNVSVAKLKSDALNTILSLFRGQLERDSLDTKTLIFKVNKLLSCMPIVFQDSLFILLYSYLSKRWFKTKINISSLTELTQEVPQRSVLGRLLCNIYLNEWFFIPEYRDVCDTTCVTKI